MPLWSMPILLGVGVFIILLAVPLALRRIPPNRWYGLRLPATFADRDVWFAANAQTGRDLIWLGALLIVVALILPILAPAASPRALALVYAIVLIVGSIVVTVRGTRLATRLLAESRRFEKMP